MSGGDCGPVSRPGPVLRTPTDLGAALDVPWNGAREGQWARGPGWGQPWWPWAPPAHLTTPGPPQGPPAQGRRPLAASVTEAVPARTDPVSCGLAPGTEALGRPAWLLPVARISRLCRIVARGQGGVWGWADGLARPGSASDWMPLCPFTPEPPSPPGEWKARDSPLLPGRGQGTGLCSSGSSPHLPQEAEFLKAVPLPVGPSATTPLPRPSPAAGISPASGPRQCQHVHDHSPRHRLRTPPPPPQAQHPPSREPSGSPAAPCFASSDPFPPCQACPRWPVASSMLVPACPPFCPVPARVGAAQQHPALPWLSTAAGGHFSCCALQVFLRSGDWTGAPRLVQDPE